MTRDLSGKIEQDIRDSVPDWAPFLAPKGAEGRTQACPVHDAASKINV